VPKPRIPYAKLTVDKHSGKVHIFALVLNEKVTKENEHASLFTRCLFNSELYQLKSQGPPDIGLYIL
jgi:hypothetical protein